jgi:hypothetical protein
LFERLSQQIAANIVKRLEAIETKVKFGRAFEGARQSERPGSAAQDEDLQISWKIFTLSSPMQGTIQPSDWDSSVALNLALSALLEPMS